METFKIIFYHQTNSTVTAIDEATAYKKVKDKYGTDKFYLEKQNDTSNPTQKSQLK